MLNLEIQDRNSKLISQDIDDDLVVKLENEFNEAPSRQKTLDEAIQNGDILEQDKVILTDFFNSENGDLNIKDYTGNEKTFDNMLALIEKQGSLGNIKELVLERVPEFVLSKLFLDAGVQKISNLESLIISQSNFIDGKNQNALFETIGKINKLGTLDLSLNSLNKMSEESRNIFGESLGRLENLEELRLNFNRLGRMNHQNQIAFLKNLGKLKSLNTLDLSYNDLLHIEEENQQFFIDSLIQMENLTDLNFGNNNLAGMDEKEQKFFLQIALVKRNIFPLNNSISLLPDLNTENLKFYLENFLSKDSSIKSLELGENYLKNFSEENKKIFLEGLGEMQNVSSLNIEGNDLGKLSPENQRVFVESLGKMGNLKELYLGSNELSYMNINIWESLGSLKNLELLNLERNSLGAMDQENYKSFVENLGKLKNLNQLDMQYNDLGYMTKDNRETFATSFGNLTNLKLNIGYNNLGEMTEDNPEAFVTSFGKLTNLTQLDIKGNNLGSMTEDNREVFAINLGNLTNLTQLDVRENNLGSMDKDNRETFVIGFGKLTNLTQLNIKDNNLGSMTKDSREMFSMGLGNLTNLTKLDIRYNNLGSMSEDNRETFVTNLGKLTNLTQLDISSNDLEYNKSIARLYSLGNIEINPQEPEGIIQALRNINGGNDDHEHPRGKLSDEQRMEIIANDHNAQSLYGLFVYNTDESALTSTTFSLIFEGKEIVDSTANGSILFNREFGGDKKSGIPIDGYEFLTSVDPSGKYWAKFFYVLAKNGKLNQFFLTIPENDKDMVFEKLLEPIPKGSGDQKIQAILILGDILAGLYGKTESTNDLYFSIQAVEIKANKKWRKDIISGKTSEEKNQNNDGSEEQNPEEIKAKKYLMQRIIQRVKNLLKRGELSKDKQEEVQNILSNMDAEDAVGIKKIYDNLDSKQQEALENEIINNNNQNFAIKLETNLRDAFEQNEALGKNKNSVVSSYMQAMILNLYEQELSKDKSENIFPKSLSSGKDYFNTENQEQQNSVDEILDPDKSFFDKNVTWSNKNISEEPIKTLNNNIVMQTSPQKYNNLVDALRKTIGDSIENNNNTAENLLTSREVFGENIKKIIDISYGEENLAKLETVLDNLYLESKNYFWMEKVYEQNKGLIDKFNNLQKMESGEVFVNGVFTKVHINYDSMKGEGLYTESRGYTRVAISDPEIDSQIKHYQNKLPDGRIINILSTQPVRSKKEKENKTRDPIKSMEKYINEQNLNIQMVDSADHSYYQQYTLNFLKNMKDSGQKIKIVNYRSCGGAGLYLATMGLIDGHHIIGTKGVGTGDVNNIMLEEITYQQESSNGINFETVRKNTEQRLKNDKFLTERHKSYEYPHTNNTAKIRLYANSILLQQ